MSNDHLHLNNITFRYDSSPDPLFDGLSLTVPEGWTGVVGANGAGKSTLLRLATRLTQPTGGSVSLPGTAVYLEQRTDDPPPDFADFLWSWDGAAARLRDQLGISQDWAERWNTLSHGERKRVQVAVALWRDPDVLAVDEPTNHLDAAARDLLADGLASFRGIGLIVSHDRTLLDRLCSRCLFLRDTGVVMRPGGVTEGLREEELELDHRRSEYRAATAERDRIKKEADRRSRAAAGAEKKKSKRFIDPKDKAAKTQMDVNRITGKDAVAGKLLRQLDGRLRHAEAKLENAPPPPARKLGVTMAGRTARSDALFRAEEGEIPVGPSRLRHPRLRIEPTDRIAVVGPNGSGKSTLVRSIVSRIGTDGLVYLPQEIEATHAAARIHAVRRRPSSELGEILSTVSRLGSDPEALLSTELPSPGETRKLLLAEGLAETPSLVILDEPTNHMDLPSIRCLEDALAETRCALLLVSHDLAFLDRLATARWTISSGTDAGLYTLRID